jgi:hypothetical protein
MRSVSLNSSLKAIAATLFFFSAGTFGQEANNTNAGPPRSVKDQMIVSQELPKATLTVAKGFRFVGTQRVNLYGNADAEQYVFVKTGPHGIVDRFYWIQFEHFLPTNQLTYSYDSKHTTQIGDLRFVYDVKGWPNLATLLASDPASDGAAIKRLLAEHDLSLPEKIALVRMFHLPSTDHRAELMIIYGEALPQNFKLPIREKGVELDTESPSLAQTLLDHAQRGLVVQAH